MQATEHTWITSEYSHTSVTRSLCTNSCYNVPCISFLLKCICMQCHTIAMVIMWSPWEPHCIACIQRRLDKVTHVHKIASCEVRQRSNLLWQIEAVIGLIPKQNSCNKDAESASMFVQPSPAQEYNEETYSALNDIKAAVKCINFPRSLLRLTTFKQAAARLEQLQLLLSWQHCVVFLGNECNCLVSSFQSCDVVYCTMFSQVIWHIESRDTVYSVMWYGIFSHVIWYIIQ